MTTQEINYYSQFPLLYNNLANIISKSDYLVLDVGCNDWISWWYTNAILLPSYFTNTNYTISVTAISRPISTPTIIEPDIVFMNKPASAIPGLPSTTSYQIVHPSSYYLLTPGFAGVNYTQVSSEADIVNICIAQQPVTDLLVLTSITIDEKKSMIDAYGTKAQYIYVENINEFQTPSWSWYWDYLQLNFNIITDGTSENPINGILTLK